MSTKKHSPGENDSAYDSGSTGSQSSNGSSSSDSSTKHLLSEKSQRIEESPTEKGLSDDSTNKEPLVVCDEDLENGNVKDKEFVKFQCTNNGLPNRLTKVTYILVCIAVLLSLATMVVTIISALQTKGQQRQRQPLTFPETCVPCIKLILNPYEPYAADPVLETLDKKLTNGIQMCCAKTAAQMSAMLECGLRDQVTRPLPTPEMSKGLKFVPASLHKKLLPPKEKECNGHCHMRFDGNVMDISEHVRGVKVDETAIIVNYTGLYSIYANIHFSVKTPPSSVNDQSVFQYVERISPNSPANTGLLLQTSHTTCIGCSNDEETAFTGGVFYLKANDELQICVTNRDAHDSTGLSYFGLIMLASGEKQ